MSIPSVFLHHLRATPGGLSVAQLLALQPGVARRSAQRQLADMVARGLIEPEGQGRGRRYRACALQAYAVSPLLPAPTVQESVAQMLSGQVSLSADSHDILAYIEQPLMARQPVGYQSEFLAAYRPNHTAYLPESLRQQLHRMGRTTAVLAHEPAGTYSRAILNRLLIDLSWASSHLEGNTYSRLDTRQLIEHGHAASGKATLETQMILNHKAAIEFLVGNIDSVGFDRYTLLNLHSALAENLLPNPADEGRVRRHAVDIGLSVYRPLSVPQRIDHELDLLLAKLNQIADPFEQSFFLMVHLPYLQPFADINKRTSRVMANLPLFKANVCPLTFLGVPEPAYRHAVLGVYEMTRVELLRDLYMWAYERSTQEYLTLRQELSEPDPLRLAWRELIKTTVRELVLRPELDPLGHISQAVQASVEPGQQASVQALIVEELRRLNEGVLARYGLRPSQWQAWRQVHEVSQPF